MNTKSEDFLSYPEHEPQETRFLELEFSIEQSLQTELNCTDNNQTTDCNSKYESSWFFHEFSSTHFWCSETPFFFFFGAFRMLTVVFCLWNFHLGQRKKKLPYWELQEQLIKLWKNRRERVSLGKGFDFPQSTLEVKEKR